MNSPPLAMNSPPLRIKKAADSALATSLVEPNPMVRTPPKSVLLLNETIYALRTTARYKYVILCSF
jgi:hypothetical protein